MALDFSQTDLDRLKQLYDDFGIHYVVKGRTSENYIDMNFWVGDDAQGKEHHIVAAFVVMLDYPTDPDSEDGNKHPRMEKEYNGELPDCHFFDASGKFIGVRIA